jgi:hypothetical protein
MRAFLLASAAIAFLPSAIAQLPNITISTANPLLSGFGGCPNIAPGPVSGFDIAAQFPAPVITDATSIEAIRQTLAVYAFAIDGRNFEQLRRVFATNARANYSDPIGVVNGIQEIIDKVTPGLLNFASTQHLYGSQHIDICSLTKAVSVTYFQASHFFVPYTGIQNTIDNSQVLIDRGQYQDTWARQGDGSWKITNRNLVRMVSRLPHSDNTYCADLRPGPGHTRRRLPNIMKCSSVVDLCIAISDS